MADEDNDDLSDAWAVLLAPEPIWLCLDCGEENLEELVQARTTNGQRFAYCAGCGRETPWPFADPTQRQKAVAAAQEKLLAAARLETGPAEGP
jgi:hypothetical protein